MVDEKPGDASTHFIFNHKIFSLDNCRFRRNGADKMPCFYVPMGEQQMAAIELAKLQQEFNIPANSIDADLLKKVEKGLNYVREIRPNDSIPREILDGSASWTVEEIHRDKAVCRMNMELIFWISGIQKDMPPFAEMQTIQASKEGREQMKEAYQRLTQILGVSDPKVVRQRIVELTRETTYIEALRDRAGKLGEIGQKLISFASAYRKEAAFYAEIGRMQDLVRRASKVVNEKFNRIDGPLRELARMLSDYRGMIQVIRTARDDIHIELKKWDEYFPVWTELKVDHNDETERFFRRFYRFLAENYMEQQAWGTVIGAGNKK